MFHLFSVDHSEIALYVAASLILFLSFHIAMHIEIPQHLSLFRAALTYRVTFRPLTLLPIS